MKVTIRMTKRQFDQFVKEQGNLGVHESELEIIVFDDIEYGSEGPRPPDKERLPVLKVEAEESYQE